MCGPSAAETGISNSQTSFMNDLMSENNAAFGESQGVLSQLNGMFSGILAKGPGQQGYTPAELNAQDSSAITNAAQSNQNEKTALQENMAAQGGGDEAVPSGVNDELQAELSANTENSKDASLNQITQNNYAQGNANFMNAAGELNDVAGQENPNSFASNATGAGSAASSTAGNIVNQQMSPWTTALGALGGIVGGASKLATGFGGGSSSAMPSMSSGYEYAGG